MKNILLAMIGSSAGVAVAAGLFTFLTITGVTNRLMALTHSSKHNLLYEWLLTLGGITGNTLWLMHPVWHLHPMLLIGIGLLIGIFIGCLIGAIAEVLDAFPVFLRRAKIKHGVKWIVIAMAFGKGIGALIWYLS